MSNSSLESVETALRTLKEIVERNHSESVETTALMRDMERLIKEMKMKSNPTMVVIGPIGLANPVVLV
jgi:hypothetical protein